MLVITQSLLGRNAAVLKSRVSKTALQGVLVAIAAVVTATLGVCYVNTGGVSLEGIIAAQKSNYALWILNAIPFVFG